MRRGGLFNGEKPTIRHPSEPVNRLSAAEVLIDVSNDGIISLWFVEQNQHDGLDETSKKERIPVADITERTSIETTDDRQSTSVAGRIWEFGSFDDNGHSSVNVTAL